MLYNCRKVLILAAFHVSEYTILASRAGRINWKTGPRYLIYKNIFLDKRSKESYEISRRTDEAVR